MGFHKDILQFAALGLLVGLAMLAAIFGGLYFLGWFFLVYLGI